MEHLRDTRVQLQNAKSHKYVTVLKCLMITIVKYTMKVSLKGNVNKMNYLLTDCAFGFKITERT
jgi:hypothetical protein